jgi:hypothetical protein
MRDVTARSSPDATLHALADMYEVDPITACITAYEAFSFAWAWPQDVLESDLPGLLTGDMYQLIDSQQHYPRSRYLQDRLRSMAPPFSTADLEIGLALADNWEGTLDSLLETIRTLAPDCS